MAKSGGQHVSYICSSHFETCDYIIPPSSAETCRLKKNAVPSLFKIFPPSLQNHGIPEETSSRLQMPEQCSSPKRPTRKRHIIDEENLSPSPKLLRDHNYAKPTNKMHSPLQKQDQSITNKKLKTNKKIQKEDDKNGRHYK